jgi:hypothetical protein
MSRSYKKNKIHGYTTCDSESVDKRIWHKRMRARERDRLITDPESEPTHENEVSSKWDMGKDGKTYWADMPPEMMRK